MAFKTFGLAEPLVRAVAEEGYTHPTPIQVEAIPHVISGRDVLGCAQTGTGKTAAFALPILHRLMQAEAPKAHGRKIRVLVLAPTRELAAQIGDSFKAYGRFTKLRHTVIFGGVGQHPQVTALRHGVDVLVATPGRLCDLMNQGHVDLHGVEIFVLDEADRMLDMGFLPDLRRVIAKLPSKRQTLFFSATMPPEIDRLAHSILRDAVQVRVTPSKPVADRIEESVCLLPSDHKSPMLVELLRSRPVGRAIVFTRTKHRADRVARQLNKAGIRAEAMHGNKSQTARVRTLESFKSENPPIVVATDIAARGIDVSAITHVFNYDLPNEPETYVHRIGRTARAGATGCAISFCDKEERAYLKAIERLTRRVLRVENDLPAVKAEIRSAEGENRPQRPAKKPRPTDRSKGPRKQRSGTSHAATQRSAVAASREIAPASRGSTASGNKKHRRFKRSLSS